jgi:FixJ family two-component response regulator
MDASSTQQPYFLVVDDDKALAKSYARLLGRFGKVTTAHGVKEGLLAFASRTRWTAIFVDWHMDDGTGADVIGPCRHIDPLVPILVVTAGDTNPIVNVIHALKAGVVTKCDKTDLGLMANFATDAMAAEVERHERVEAVVVAWTVRYGLTSQQAALLRLAFSGTPRSALAEKLGLMEATVKSYINEILHKTRDASLPDAVARAFREIVTGPVESPT